MPLTAARTSALLGWLVLSLAGGCTKDFSRFEFLPQSGRDGGHGGSDAGGALPALLPPDAATPDLKDARAAMDAMQAGSSGSRGGAGGVGGRHMPPEAGSHAGTGDEDATVDSGSQTMKPDAMTGQPTDEDLCNAAYPTLLDEREACRSCTCQECTAVSLDCLTRADAYERTACTELWKCAIANNCHDWDCYCSTQRCRMTPSAPGDGPCFMQMEMAAQGDREAVNAAHLNNDPKNPLVRAIRAIGCTVGTPSGSVGGATAPMCKDSCVRSSGGG